MDRSSAVDQALRSAAADVGRLGSPGSATVFLVNTIFTLAVCLYFLGAWDFVRYRYARYRSSSRKDRAGDTKANAVDEPTRASRLRQKIHFRMLQLAKSDSIAPMTGLWESFQTELDLNWQDHEGNTALIWACRSNAKRAAEFLLKNGADHNLGNTRGFTALYFADRAGHKDLCATLKASGLKTKRTTNTSRRSSNGSGNNGNTHLGTLPADGSAATDAVPTADGDACSSPRAGEADVSLSPDRSKVRWREGEAFEQIREIPSIADLFAEAELLFQEEEKALPESESSMAVPTPPSIDGQHAQPLAAEPAAEVDDG